MALTSESASLIPFDHTRAVRGSAATCVVHFRWMPERNLHVTERTIAEPLALERVAEVTARVERELGRSIVGPSPCGRPWQLQGRV